MALEPTDRSGPARLRRRGAALAAAALAALAALTVTAAAPTIGSPEQSAEPQPNFRRVAVTSPGAVFDILGQPEPLATGPLAGEVALARRTGEAAMTTANLVLGGSGRSGDLGEVAVAIRPEDRTAYQYNPTSRSIVYTIGLEFEVDSVPGMAAGGDRVHLYTRPIRLPSQATAPGADFPPRNETFRLPSPVLLWEGEDGVTGAEPIGMMTDFAITVTHPA